MFRLTLVAGARRDRGVRVRVPGHAADAKQMEANKKAVVAFYDAAINHKDFGQRRSYLGPQYKQHNPTAADGAEGLKSFIEFLKSRFPNQKGEIKSRDRRGRLGRPARAFHARRRHTAAAPSSTSSGWRTARSSSTGT